MKARILKKSDAQQIKESTINITTQKVMKFVLNIVLNILKIDYNFSEDQLKEFYDKFNAVVLDVNDELADKTDYIEETYTDSES